MVVPSTKITTKKCVVLASKIDQLFIGVGIKPRPRWNGARGRFK